MNDKRRKEILDIKASIKYLSGLLDKQRDKLRDVLAFEDAAFSNMPENLQDSMRGMESQDAMDAMDTAIDHIKEAIESLDEII
jgi:hypothetical protein